MISKNHPDNLPRLPIKNFFPQNNGVDLHGEVRLGPAMVIHPQDMKLWLDPKTGTTPQPMDEANLKNLKDAMGK